MLEKTNSLYASDVKAIPAVCRFLGFLQIAYLRQPIQNEDASIERQECRCLLLQLLLFQQRREHTQHRTTIMLPSCLVFHCFGEFHLHRPLRGSDRRVE